MSDSRTSGRVSRWPLIIAAVVVAAGAVVFFFISRPARKPVNAAGLTAAGIRALAGDGLLEGPEARFTWSRDARADIYRIEVYDLTSRLLAAAVLRDTTVPASALLPDTARAGVWRVIPVSPGGTELPPSPTARFHRP
ncbi:MAG: hypothetical protein ABIS67_08250 [Candidatus Eisenbacteria bacterium]